MEDKLLQLILDYQMTKEEAKAWKIAIMYLDNAKKFFPDYNHYSFGKGDPRKTELFRYCYKLIQECDHLLKNSEYRLYLTAQFHVMRNIDNQAFISPNCIVGPKAWKRWLVWKKRFDEMVIQEKPSINIHSNNKVINALAETKVFLVRKLKELTKKSILDILDSKMLFRWCGRGHVSGYYLVLSPIVREWCEARNFNLLDGFAIDLKLYQAGITREIEDWFRKEFEYEISN